MSSKALSLEQRRPSDFKKCKGHDLIAAGCAEDNDSGIPVFFKTGFVDNDPSWMATSMLKKLTLT